MKLLTTLRTRLRTFARRILMRDSRYYQLAYRKADLDQDYWSIVGPASPEDFESLGHGKRQLLVDHGLTPSSRVLDVGCGTGLLTAALTNYLGPAGLYVGTDIAPEAVAFCKRKFGRPNFVFALSAMTRVPVIAENFDFAFLGSVLTHIYPREITALLANIRPLLAANGTIIADAFFAPGIGTHRGDRGLVVIDEAHLLDCFRGAGYVHEEIERYQWRPDVQRGIFQLRRAGQPS